MTDVFEVDCTAPEGFVDIDGDCDDTDADINPDGLEECDGLDTDCDGEAGTDQIRQFRGTVRARGTRVPITASGDRSVGWVASLSGRWAAPGRQRVRLPARASREPRQGPVQGGSRVA